MSLATRCPSCGTVFRVVQEQLETSEGWVRCGRCEEVFSAVLSLFDLEREAPPPWPMATARGAAAPEPAVPATSGAALRPDEDAFLLHTPSAEAQPSPAVARAPASARATAEPELDASAEVAPAFLRSRDDGARWQGPRSRLAFAVAAPLFAALLLAQFALHWRDPLAARWPAARPVLQSMCAAAGCRIEPLRRIESLAVDSSGLTRLTTGANAYRLSVVLRNRDVVPLTLPALDLTLTDAQGQLVARKVLQASELGAPQATLAAGAELALQGLLDPGERRLAGYTVEIFYP